MSVDSHPHDLLVEEDRRSPTRDGPRRTEDLRILLEAMLTSDADEVVAKNDTEFSRLLAIPRARVASALAVGEQRGVFVRRALPLDSRTGDTEIVWQLSPVFIDLHGKFAQFAENYTIGAV